MLKLERPWTRQPQGAVRLRPKFADVDTFLLGSTFRNQGNFGGQPSFGNNGVYGNVDGLGGKWFGPPDGSNGYISLPNTAVSAGSRFSGVVIFYVPALMSNGVLWNNCYDRATAPSDPGFQVSINLGGGVDLTYQDTANIYNSGSVISAGKVNVVAWSYDGASGRGALVVNGIAATFTNTQPVQTTRLVQNLGAYYDISAVGVGEKRFYLFGLWGREMSVQQLLEIGTSPAQTYLALIAHQRIWVPQAASLPTITALTPSLVTGSTALQRFTRV